MFPFPGENATETTETTVTTTTTTTTTTGGAHADDTAADAIAELADADRAELEAALAAAGYKLVAIDPPVASQAPAVVPSAEPAQPATPPAPAATDDTAAESAPPATQETTPAPAPPATSPVTPDGVVWPYDTAAPTSDAPPPAGG